VQSLEKERVLEWLDPWEKERLYGGKTAFCRAFFGTGACPVKRPGKAKTKGRHVKIERRGKVFVLRMDQGENRFNRPFLDAFHAALDEVEAEEGPLALVTTGDGKFYSNGLDLDWLTGEGKGEAEAFLDGVLNLYARILAFPGYTVAAMNGHAIAVGAMLSLAHDARVMRADRGWWSIPEVDLGLPLRPGMTAIIRARLPIAVAHEAIVTGRRYGGGEACALGIVQHAVPLDQVLPFSVELAAQHAEKNRPVLALLKEGLYKETLAVLRAEDASLNS